MRIDGISLPFIFALRPFVQSSFKRRTIQANFGLESLRDHAQILHGLVFRFVVKEELRNRF